MGQHRGMLCKTSLISAQLLAGWLPNSTGFQDSDTHPIRCHYEMEEDADRCGMVLGAVEAAWTAQVDEIGFPAPVPDGDGLLDVYLHVDPAGGAYAWCGTNPDVDDKDGRSGCAAIIAIDREIPDKILPWYLAHEFNHTLQWAIDFNEGSLPVWEGTATAAEVWTDDSRFVIDKAYVDDFQATPWLGLLGDGNFLWDEYEIWSYTEYGSALWIQYLDTEYGDGRGSGGLALWLALAQEGLPNNPDVLDGVESLTGDWRDALMDFSLLRTRIGTLAAPEWSKYLDDQGVLVPDARLAAAEGLLTPVTQPYETGAVFWVLTDLPANRDISLRVDGEEEGEWGVLWATDSAGAWERSRSLTFTPPVGTTEVWVGVVNLDHAVYARTAATQALKNGQQQISLEIGLPESEEPQDTGGSGDSDTGIEESPGEDSCGGCSGTRGRGAWWMLSGLVLLRRRGTQGT